MPDRIGPPSIGMALLAKALIFAGCGYVFLALRIGNRFAIGTDLFAKLRTGSGKLNDLCGFGVIPHDSTAEIFAMVAVKLSINRAAQSARSPNIQASCSAMS